MSTYCKKCKGLCVMYAMQHKICSICKNEFLASNIPGEDICSDCEDKYPELCIMCGTNTEEKE